MKRDRFPFGPYHPNKHDEPTNRNYLLSLRPRFIHSKPTIKKYSLDRFNDIDPELISPIKCPYCFLIVDGGDTRFFEGNDDLIHFACKPCLWKLGVRYCTCGDKIFGKGAC